MISENLQMEASHYGQKFVVVGKSGSGKSYTSRVIIEEGQKLGVTFLIIDPQDAYENLEGFSYIKAEAVKDAKKLGVIIAASSKNCVVSTKGMTIKDQQKFIKHLLEGYRTTTRRGIRTIVIDECHKFAPEGIGASSKEEVQSMSQENRSDGLGFIAVEQRPARVSKTIIAQADVMVIHQMTAHQDLRAIEGYLDDPQTELDQIKKLEVGEAYINGLEKEPSIHKIRKAETKHSGEAPKTLLTEDTKTFNQYISKVTRRGGLTMKEDVSTKIVNVPSVTGFMDLVANGAKMSLGLATAGFVGAFASRWRSPIPVISTRTLAGALTTIAVYTGYKKIKNNGVKNVLGYAAAGSAVHTAGSLAFDVISVTNVKLPSIVAFALNTMTGVSPINVEGTAASGNEPELNTAFA